MISNLDESIITGIFAMSGSLCSRLMKVVIAFTPSSRASSMFTSITWAPLSTCWRATLNASSYLFSLMSRANFFEPGNVCSFANVHKIRFGANNQGFEARKSQIWFDPSLFTHVFIVILIPFPQPARCLRCKIFYVLGDMPDVIRGGAAAASNNIHISFVVPTLQINAAVSCGCSSYSPIAFGSPALGYADT